MTARGRSLAVALAHVLLVGSIGGKLLWDRAVCPRVWARSGPYDPDLPIRGRYVSLQLEVADGGLAFEDSLEWTAGALTVRNDQLTAVAGAEGVAIVRRTRDGRPTLMLSDPVAFFIPEHAADPSDRKPGEELWVEVTVPHHGLPRPIRLGVKRDGGSIEPLPLD